MLGGVQESAAKTTAGRDFQVILSFPGIVSVTFISSRPPQDADSRLGGADADDCTREQSPGINQAAQDQFKAPRADGR